MGDPAAPLDPQGVHLISHVQTGHGVSLDGKQVVLMEFWLHGHGEETAKFGCTPENALALAEAIADSACKAIVERS